MQLHLFSILMRLVRKKSIKWCDDSQNIVIDMDTLFNTTIFSLISRRLNHSQGDYVFIKAETHYPSTLIRDTLWYEVEGYYIVICSVNVFIFV